MGIAHIRYLARRMACAAVVVVASLAGASPAAAAMPPACQDPFFTGRDVCRAEPISPAGVPAGALDRLGSTGSPEDDLMQAVKDLGAASDDPAASRARGRALAILTGDATELATEDSNFLKAKAYEGIPLLNTKAKVQTDLG